MLRQRFAQAFTEYETAMLLATAYRADALPKAEQVYQLYVEAFQQRRAAWPQVLDAQREYYELYEEYLDNLVEARRAEARINAFFLEDGLSQPPAPSPEGHRDATPRPR
jgi:cobalt-zinc-cadmium efflux system outer membrane protein